MKKLFQTFLGKNQAPEKKGVKVETVEKIEPVLPSEPIKEEPKKEVVKPVQKKPEPVVVLDEYRRADLPSYTWRKTEYINGTKFVTSHGKKMKNWLKRKSTKQILLQDRHAILKRPNGERFTLVKFKYAYELVMFATNKQYLDDTNYIMILYSDGRMKLHISDNVNDTFKLIQETNSNEVKLLDSYPCKPLSIMLSLLSSTLPNTNPFETWFKDSDIPLSVIIPLTKA
jgi:hypothetical protein